MEGHKIAEDNIFEVKNLIKKNYYFNFYLNSFQKKKGKYRLKIYRRNSLRGLRK